MIVYTCPKCGNPLTDEVITTYPPIDAKRCHACGYYHTNKQTENTVEYVRYDPPEENE